MLLRVPHNVALITLGVSGMSGKNILRALGVAIISAVCLSACTPEEYGACTIPNTTAYKTACRDTVVTSDDGKSTTTKQATCTADYVFDCDSMLCGVYEGSSPFCTRRCIPSDCTCKGQENCLCDCPAGKNCEDECPDGAACVEWIAGSGSYFCLPEDKGCKDGFNYSSIQNRTDPRCN